MIHLPERTFRFLALLLLFGVGTCLCANAQNWQEYHVLNQDNYLQFQRNVLYQGNIVQTPDPALGTLTQELNGSKWSLRFTPVDGAHGVAEFIIEYFPDHFPPAPKIEAFRVYVSSSWIDAKKDYLTVQESSEDNVLDVLANDVPHPDSAQLSIGYVAAVVNGFASISGDNHSVLFTPGADFTGMAYLTYVVCDNYGACTKAEADICVMSSGPLPAMDTMYLSTDNRTPVVAFMPADGFAVTDDPDHGTLSGLSPDTWQYTPNIGFTGTDHFALASDTLTRYVVIKVYYKDPPNSFVNPDVIFTRVDSPVTFNVLSNDVKAYPVTAHTTPDKGVLDFDAPGTFTYTPDSGYVGAQAFTYTTCFLGNCETGDVIVYVGDMVPENAETYDLVTQKNVPLVLNYEIPLEGYYFAVHAPPGIGDLTLYNDEQSVDVLCSTVQGYDLLVYTPADDYVGSDYFEVVYCIDGGECHLVKVNVTVEDADPMSCACVDHCIWPGDADASGRVDLYDLLSIGWQTGMTGPDRNYPNNTAWIGQNGEDWSSALWGMNSKYADSDGDGVIGSSDMTAISDYYLRTHTLVPEIIGLKADYEFDIIPLTEQVDSGDLAVFEISIGTESNPVLDMHGVAFSLNLPPDLVDTNTITMQFYDDSWLGYDAPSLQMEEQPWGGRLDAAFTRTSGTPASGIGVIGVMTCIVTDDFDGFKTPDGRTPLKIGVNGVRSMASSGLTYEVPGSPATIYIKHDISNATPLEQEVFVFPNPSAGDQLNVHVNGNRALREIDIYDLSGSLIASSKHLTGKYFSPDISALSNGLYILRITTTDGVVSRKFEVLRKD